MNDKDKINGLLLLLGMHDIPVLEVSDGFVSKKSKCWWKSVDGPYVVSCEQDWDNIKQYPHLYSLEKPRFKLEYL